MVQNANYLPAPDMTGTLIDVTSLANSVDNNYTLSFGVRADQQDAADRLADFRAAMIEQN